MKKYRLFKQLLAVAIISTLYTSCYTGYQPTGVPVSRQKENIYYVPTTPNTGLSPVKGDVNISLLRPSENNFGGFEAQVATHPTNHLSLGAAVLTGSNKDGGQKYTSFYRVEMGAGYYTPRKRRWQFEALAGAGFGSLKNYHVTGTSNISQVNYFVQPAFAYNNKEKTFHLNFSSRFTFVQFKVKDTSFSTNAEYYSAAQLKSLYSDPGELMWEPAIIMKAGYKNLFFHLGYTGVINVNPVADYLGGDDLNIAKGNLSFGVTARLLTKGVKRQNLPALNSQSPEQ